MKIISKMRHARIKFDIYISGVSLQLLFNIRTFELNFQLPRIIKK